MSRGMGFAVAYERHRRVKNLDSERSKRIQILGREYRLGSIYRNTVSGNQRMAIWDRFRIVEQKRRFCEAVNCERSEQEGKFLFAMLVSILWFPPPSKTSWHNARESAESCGTIYLEK